MNNSFPRISTYIIDANEHTRLLENLLTKPRKFITEDSAIGRRSAHCMAPPVEGEYGIDCANYDTLTDDP